MPLVDLIHVLLYLWSSTLAAGSYAIPGRLALPMKNLPGEFCVRVLFPYAELTEADEGRTAFIRYLERGGNFCNLANLPSHPLKPGEPVSLRRSFPVDLQEALVSIHGLD